MNTKDWTGNKNSVLALSGVNRKPETRAFRDLYTTSREAVEKLLSVESFVKIWEPACGLLHISNVLEEHGYYVWSTDIDSRGLDIPEIDFLKCTGKWDGDIVTNPPYSLAEEFVRKSLEMIQPNNKVAMLLRLQFLEGQKRRKLFDEYPPFFVYVFSKRINCPKNGDLSKPQHSTMSFAWFVWRKGYQGPPCIRWI